MKSVGIFVRVKTNLLDEPGHFYMLILKISFACEFNVAVSATHFEGQSARHSKDTLWPTWRKTLST